LLGKIDDLDQVFINGQLIGGTGDLVAGESRRVHTSYEHQEFRGYYIPAGLLRENQVNVIAVRVYDSGGIGGIYQGPVGLITQESYINFWRKRKYALKAEKLNVRVIDPAGLLCFGGFVF
jgi:hypothetical protein